MSRSMKALVYSEYGPPDVLDLQHVGVPVVKENEVLVRVRATSVNASDWEFLTGSPFYARMYGLFKPAFSILGSDIAGVVETVGSNVTMFRPGDEVLGNIMRTLGGFAEFVCVPETALVKKPSGLSFAQASTLPQAATVALQAIRDKGKVSEGHKVLVNGAAGGVGSFTVQIAKIYGAHITAVDSVTKLDMLRAIGADAVVNYQLEDFTQNQPCFDLIVDVVGNRSIFDLRACLVDGGTYAVVGGRVLQALLVGSMLTMATNKSLGILVWKPNAPDLSHVAELCAQGLIKPIIDDVYELAETPRALAKLGAGETLGIGVVVQA